MATKASALSRLTRAHIVPSAAQTKAEIKQPGMRLFEMFVLVGWRGDKVGHVSVCRVIKPQNVSVEAQRKGSGRSRKSSERPRKGSDRPRQRQRKAKERQWKVKEKQRTAKERRRKAKERRRKAKTKAAKGQG